MMRVLKRLSNVLMLGTVGMALQAPGCNVTLDEATIMGLLDSLGEFSNVDLEIKFEADSQGGGHDEIGDDHGHHEDDHDSEDD